MDLIHKENIIFVQIGQKCRQISRFFNGRSGGNAEIDAHLIGDDAGQRCLAQTGRAVEQNMIQRFLPHPRRLDEHLKVAFCLFLTNILPQRFRTQRGFVVILQRMGGRQDRLLSAHLIVGKIYAHVFSLTLHGPQGRAERYG